MRIRQAAAIGILVLTAGGLASAQQQEAAATGKGAVLPPARMVAIGENFLLNVNAITSIVFTGREGDRGRVDIQFANGTGTTVIVTKNEWAAARDAILTAGK